MYIFLNIIPNFAFLSPARRGILVDISSNMGMCERFFKDANNIYNFMGAKSEIIQNLLSHSPPYGDVQVTFSRFY